jgi:RNA polymerase sigma factor (sigma-70 family)
MTIDDRNPGGDRPPQTTSVATPRLEDLVAAALAGNAQALDQLLRQVEPLVFRLAMRMLGNLADAEDATQEVLIKVATALSAFAGRSRLSTWVYAVAANHLRDAATRRAGAPTSLEAMAARLEQGMAVSAALEPVDLAADPALALEAREVGLRCTQGMLMALDVDQRLALVLTEVFGLDGAEAATVLGISHDALRQRASRAKRTMEEFLLARCSLADPAGRCRCERQAQAKRSVGAPMQVQWCLRAPQSARQEAAAVRAADLTAARDELAVLQRYAQVLRAGQTWSATPALHQKLRAVMAASPLLGGGSARLN